MRAYSSRPSASRLGSEVSAVINRVRCAFGPISMRSSAASPQIHQAEKVVDQAARQLLRGEAEWPDVDPEAMSWENAASEVLQRFFYSHVFATFAQVRSWSQFGVRKLKNVLGQMEGDGRLRAKQVEGLVVAADDDLQARVPDKGVFLLHKADALVKSHIAELKERFGRRETLQYLLVDGAFAGAVCGHWRIGPHDVDDVVLDLCDEQVEARRQEVVAEVGGEYRPPRSHILRYQGCVL